MIRPWSLMNNADVRSACGFCSSLSQLWKDWWGFSDFSCQIRWFTWQAVYSNWDRGLPKFLPFLLTSVFDLQIIINKKNPQTKQKQHSGNSDTLKTFWNITNIEENTVHLWKGQAHVLTFWATFLLIWLNKGISNPLGFSEPTLISRSSTVANSKTKCL